MRGRAVVLGVVLLVAGGRAGAQAVADTSAPAGVRRDTSNAAAWLEGGWLAGGSVGLPGYGSEVAPQLLTIGLHWTEVRSHGVPGLDISLGTMPFILGQGGLVFGARGGVALPVAATPRLLVLPSAGFSLIGAVGGDVVTVSGMNAGIAAVSFGTGSTGLRTGITWHKFQDARGLIWLLEVGVVGLHGGSSRATRKEREVPSTSRSQRIAPSIVPRSFPGAPLATRFDSCVSHIQIPTRARPTISSPRF